MYKDVYSVILSGLQKIGNNQNVHQYDNGYITRYYIDVNMNDLGLYV